MHYRGAARADREMPGHLFQLTVCWPGCADDGRCLVKGCNIARNLSLASLGRRRVVVMSGPGPPLSGRLASGPCSLLCS